MENQNQENNNKNSSIDKESWIKFALLIVAIFLGSYLATYFVIDQSRHAYYQEGPYFRHMMPQREMMFDDFNDKMFLDEFRNIEKQMKKSNAFASRPIVKVFNTEDSLKFVVCLKPFDMKAENVKVDVKGNQLTIQGKSEKVKKHSDNVFVFNQSYTLPENVDVSKISKKEIHKKLIITIPFIEED